MWFRVAFVLCLSAVCVQTEYLIKKFCSDVPPHMCEVYNVLLDPCPDGHDYCTVRRAKRYTLTVDFMPNFQADKLNISMSADDGDSGSYDKVIKTSGDACDYLTCPVEAQMRRIFDVDFSLNKAFAVGKYPIKVKLISQEDDTKICCFTFIVKTIK